MNKEMHFLKTIKILKNRFLLFLSMMRYRLIYFLLPMDSRKSLDKMVCLQQSHYITLGVRLNGKDFAYDIGWIKYLQKNWTKHAETSNVSSWPLIGDYAIYYEGFKPEIPYRSFVSWKLAQEAADDKNEEALFYYEEPLWKVYKFK